MTLCVWTLLFCLLSVTFHDFPASVRGTILLWCKSCQSSSLYCTLRAQRSKNFEEAPIMSSLLNTLSTCYPFPSSFNQKTQACHFFYLYLSLSMCSLLPCYCWLLGGTWPEHFQKRRYLGWASSKWPWCIFVFLSIFYSKWNTFSPKYSL